MCDCGEQYDDVMERLELMDKARNESDVLPLVKEIANDMKQMKKNVDKIEKRTDKQHLFLFGNGEMTKSFVYKSEQYFQEFDRHMKDAEKKEQAEKEKAEKNEGRKWDLIKPIINRAIELAIFGGGLLWVFSKLSP